MHNFIVFGGSGFFGRNLTRSLKRLGTVTVFDNNERGYDELENINGINYIHGDICDAKAVEEAVNGHDTVFNLAYINGTKNFYSIPGRILEIAALGQINIGRAINKSPVENFIYFSSSEAYQNPKIFPTPENVDLKVPNPENPRFSYGGGKIFGELLTWHHVENAKRKIIIRPHNIYGPNMGEEHVIPQLGLRAFTEDKDHFQIQGSGSETRSFCFIDDAVAAVDLILRKGREGTYNVGSGEEISIESLAKLVLQYFGRTTPVKGSELTRGSAQKRCPDVSKIANLGFSPNVSLECGIQQTLDWYIDRWQ